MQLHGYVLWLLNLVDTETSTSIDLAQLSLDQILYGYEDTRTKMDNFFVARKKLNEFQRQRVFIIYYAVFTSFTTFESVR